MERDSLKVLIASLATLGVVAGVGWGASNILNGKANAAEVLELQKEHATLRAEIVTREDFKRLEDKVDTLLLRNGIKPETIK